LTDYIIFGVTYGFAAAAQPGPFQTFIISQTLINGWRKTLPASFAPLLSDGPIIILVLIVLSTMPAWLIKILQIGGGLLLLYLAYNACKAWREYDLNVNLREKKTDQTLLKATFVNILNPNAYIGWSLIMGPLFIRGYNETPANGIALIVSFYSILILGMAGIILIFGMAKNLGPKVTRITLGLSSIALAGFGFFQLWLGLNAWEIFS
jgi:threonine/homoserine/homoserine lactone efflux protein